MNTKELAADCSLTVNDKLVRVRGHAILAIRNGTWGLDDVRILELETGTPITLNPNDYGVVYNKLHRLGVAQAHELAYSNLIAAAKRLASGTYDKGPAETKKTRAIARRDDAKHMAEMLLFLDSGWTNRTLPLPKKLANNPSNTTQELNRELVGLSQRAINALRSMRGSHYESLVTYMDAINTRYGLGPR